MKRLPALLLTALVFTPAVWAEGPQATAAPASAERAPSVKGLLWEIEGEGGTRGWLLGSLHFAEPSLYPLDPAIRKAFQDSGVLAVEVDLRKLEAAALQREITRLALAQPGQEIEVPEATRTRLEKTATALGVAPATLTPFEPWWVALMLSRAALARSELNPDLGLERWFLENLPKGRKVVELETVTVLFYLLDRLPGPVQVRFLEQTLDEVDGTAVLARRILEAWQAGDEAAMAELTHGTSAGDPLLEPVREAVYLARNRWMTEKIHGLLEDKRRPPFVLIGAGHMVGPGSVPELLAARGWRVRRR